MLRMNHMVGKTRMISHVIACTVIYAACTVVCSCTNKHSQQQHALCSA